MKIEKAGRHACCRRLAGLTTAIATAGLLFAAAGLTAPADQAVPSGETVVERAVEALGGRAALEKLQNRVLRGNMEIPGLGIKAPMAIYQARPALKYVHMTSSATGDVDSGCDGQICWQNSSMQGPKIEQGSELTQSLRDADFDGIADWRRWYTKAECVGADSAAGATTWKVVMTPREGENETWYFDQSSGLPVKESDTVLNEMGAIPIVSYPGDFRRIGGVLVPFRTRQVLLNGLQTVVMVVDSVAYNVDIPADRFTPPSEIRALLEKKAATGAAPAESSHAPWGGPVRGEEKRK